MRPKNPPTWATDDSYAVGGETWSATPTKVAPSAGMRQTGHIPEQAPSAQIENYDRNLEGQWWEYLQDLQVLNWPYKVELGSAVASGNLGLGIATTGVSIIMVGGVAGNGGDPNIKVSFDGGESFLDSTIANQNLQAILSTVASSNTTVIAGGPSAGGSPGGQNIYRSTDSGGTWDGNIALPGTAGTGFSIYHMIRHGSVFVAVGNDGAGTPAAYCATSPDGASGNWTQRTLPGGSGSRIAWKAVSGAATGVANRLVVFGSDNAGAGTLGWYSDDNGVNFSNFTAPTNHVIGAAYSTAEKVWMCLGRSGNDATVHISTDGITWGSSLATLQFAGAASTPANAGSNQIAVAGSLWIVASTIVNSGFQSRIYWSTNNGTNWKVIGVGEVNHSIKSVHAAAPIQVGFHGILSLSEVLISGSDVSTNYRQSLRMGLVPSL